MDRIIGVERGSSGSRELGVMEPKVEKNEKMGSLREKREKGQLIIACSKSQVFCFRV